MKRNALTLCLVLASLALGAAPWHERNAAAEGENIILNGRFEAEQSDVPAFWGMDDWDHPENFELDPTGGPGGLPCIIARAPAPGKVNSLGFHQYGFRLYEKGRYLLSGWVRKRGFAPGRRSGFVLSDSGWKRDCGVDFKGGDCDWTYFEREVHALESGNGLMKLNLFVSNYTGSLALADVKLRAMDEETRSRTEGSLIAAAQNVPRLVPWQPRLSEVPRENPRVAFRFYGKVPDPSACEIALSVDGSVVDRSALPAKGTDVWLTLPKNKALGRFTASIRKRDGETLFSRDYDFRMEDGCTDFPEGKRLNEMVVELHNGAVPADGVFRFGLAHGGWVFIALEGADEAQLDGKAVIGASTPRHETFRELSAGRHEIRTAGSAARLIVRRIPELFDYAPCNSPLKENPPYDWAFQERYVLPAVTTMNGGDIPPGARARYRASGRLWLANLISRNLVDGRDLTARLAATQAMTNAASFHDGVTCDEQGFTDVPTMARYAEGLWAYDGRLGRRAYTWVIGSPATEGVDHDLLSAAANGAGGRGRYLSEIYLVAPPTEAKALAALKLAAKDKIRRVREFSPLADRSYGIIFGVFNQPPGISLCACPEVDYRYYLDMQFNLLANDPDFRDLACTGVWGSYRADDELHRWTFMLMRHYFVEGRKEMLSPEYGFRYLPGHLRNPDFTEGLAGWKTSGEVGIRSKTEFGLKTEGRWMSPRGCGDTFAVLGGGEGAVSRVEQTATALEPGRKYVLRFAAFDADDVVGDVLRPHRVGLELSLDGGEIDAALSWEHVDEAKGKKSSINYRQVVFTARHPEVGIAFSTSASSGRHLGLNYISLQPYLPR